MLFRDFQCVYPNPLPPARILAPSKFFMNKPKVHVVQDPGKGPDPVSAVSRAEEAHLLSLADTALNNATEGGPIEIRAGEHTRQEHQRLKQDLQDIVDRLEHPKDSAA